MRLAARRRRCWRRSGATRSRRAGRDRGRHRRGPGALRGRMPARVLDQIRDEAWTRRLLAPARHPAPQPVPPVSAPGEDAVRRVAAPRAAAPGERVEVTVESAVYRGQGLARHHGQVVFVPRGLPGDRLRVRVVSVTPGYVEGGDRGGARAGRGPRRVALSALRGRAAGAPTSTWTPGAQAALKEAVLRDALRRAGAPWDEPIPVRASPPEGWRTRATLHVEHAPRRLAPRLPPRRAATGGRRRALPPALAGDDGGRARPARRAGRAAGPGPGRARRRAGGVLRRRAGWSPRLETAFDQRQAAGAAVLADAVPALTGLRRHGGRGAPPPVPAPARRPARRGHRARHPPARARPVLLPGQPLPGGRRSSRRCWTARRPGGSVLDLYAGVGLFALPLGRRAEEVRGLEISPSAVADARGNAEARRPLPRPHPPRRRARDGRAAAASATSAWCSIRRARARAPRSCAWWRRGVRPRSCTSPAIRRRSAAT